jgi:hypothetical protein
MVARLEQRHLRWGLGLALLALVAYFVFLIVTGTVESRAYFREHRPFRPPGTFPMGAVVVSCGLLLVQAVALWWFVTGTWSTFRKRALVAFAACLGSAFILSLGMHVHAPPYVTYHFLWLLCAAALSLGLVVISTSVYVVRRLAGNRPGSG